MSPPPSATPIHNTHTLEHTPLSVTSYPSCHLVSNYMSSLSPSHRFFSFLPRLLYFRLFRSIPSCCTIYFFATPFLLFERYRRAPRTRNPADRRSQQWQITVSTVFYFIHSVDTSPNPATIHLMCWWCSTFSMYLYIHNSYTSPCATRTRGGAGGKTDRSEKKKRKAIMVRVE